MPSYAEVEPIFDRSCNDSACHSPSNVGGPWPLNSYAHIVPWLQEVGDNVRSCSMPPPEALPLPPEDRLLLMQWIRCDMPR